MHNDVITMTLASSKFWPVAIGFFGLGTGYLVAGGQALFSDEWLRHRREPDDHLERRQCQRVP